LERKNKICGKKEEEAKREETAYVILFPPSFFMEKPRPLTTGITLATPLAPPQNSREIWKQHFQVYF